MTRYILSGVLLVLATSGVALAGGDQSKAGQNSPFSLKPVVNDGYVGSQGEPASLVKRKAAPTANNGQSRAYSFGSQGTTASMVQNRQNARGYTNVVPAGPERSGNAGRPASLVSGN